MIENVFVTNVWLAVVAGAFFYTADYALTLLAIHLYQAGAKNYIVVEGRPDFISSFQPDDVKHRARNVRFLVALILISCAILAMSELLVEQSNRPEIFSFLIGGLLFLYTVACLQDVRDIALFRFAQHTRGEKVSLSERLFYGQTALEFGICAVICGVIFLMTTSWFFLGGAVTCFVTGRRRRDWAMIIK
jgi:hypothetical protein